MGTHCLIGVRIGDTIKYIQCQYDGYIQGVGLTLQSSYETLEKVAKLIEQGDTRAVNEFNSEAYGDACSEARVVPSIQDFNLDSGKHVGFLYLFQNEWKVRFKPNLEFVPLRIVLK